MAGSCCFAALSVSLVSSGNVSAISMTRTATRPVADKLSTNLTSVPGILKTLTIMTEEDVLKQEQTYSESKIQHFCVNWFRRTFPHVANLLFAVPNGGWRGARAGAQMVYDGQVKGVADLILLFPKGGKSSLCIEMKVPKRKGSRAGKQSDEQIAWQRLVEEHGSTYVVCHGIVEFVRAVCIYLQTNPQPYIDKALNLYPTYQ